MATSTSIGTPDGRYNDYLHLMEYAEANVRERINRLSASELKDDRASVIARYMPDLIIQVPTVNWSSAKFRAKELGSGQWQHSLTAPVCDPSSVLWSVEWSVSPWAEVDYEVDSERGILAVIERISASKAEDARTTFIEDLAQFKENLLKSQMDFERYNSALPYLISFWIEARREPKFCQHYN